MLRILPTVLLAPALLALPAAAQVIISEFMADNTRTLADEDGAFTDWIELHNPGTGPVTLDGWALTDNLANLRKWTLPSGVTLPANGYRLVFASNKNRRQPAGELHANFKLEAAGEPLALVRPDDSLASLFNPFPAQMPDVSYGAAATNLVVASLGPASTGRYRIPASGAETNAWTAVGFDDTAWPAAVNGIGFETGVPELGPGLVGDLLDHSPAGCWRLEETGTVGLVASNSVSGGQPGQYLGGPTLNVATLQAPTYPGFEADNQGARFDGVNDKVEIPHQDNLNNTSYSFSAWFKVNAAAAVHRAVVSARDDNAAAPFNQRGYILYVEPSGNIGFWSGTGTAWHTLAGPAATPGVWYQVVGTYDAATQTKRLYTNGVQHAQATGVVFSRNAQRPLRIGAGRNELATGDYWFNGDIDEVAVWDRALSAAEATAVSQAARSGVNAPGVLLGQNPAGYWRLKDSTTPATVSAANAGTTGAAGVASGGITTGVAGPRPAAQAGYPADNRAFRFDGASGKVDVPANAAHNPTHFTVELWARCTGGAGTYRSPLTSRDDLPQRGFIFYAANDNRWQFWSGAGAQDGWHAQVGPAVALNAWTHLAGSYDGVTKKFYVNGALVAQGATVLVPNTTQPLRIGAGASETAGSFWFPGEVDEVAVTPRVLTDAEIAERHARALSGAAQNDYGALIQTNVQAAMHNQNAGAHLRLPFTVPNPAAVDRLTLRMQYDDGFIAYLNGAPVASANAPTNAVWNSAATARNPNHLAVQPEEFGLNSAINLLQPGANVLAVHALNRDAGNPDFLCLPRLEVIDIGVYSANFVYQASASPGSANGVGTPEPGPSLVSAAFTPSPLHEASNLVITVRALPVLGAVTNVTLRWRVGFGAESAVVMADDGLSGDGAANDGVYGATVPATAYAAAEMVRWRFTAADNAGRTSRLPPYPDPLNSPEYLGTMTLDTTGFTSALPVWYWFAASPAAADTRAGTRGAVFFGGEFYDNVFIRQRGGATSTNSRKYDFNGGHHCRINAEVGRVEEANLNGSSLDGTLIRPALAFEVFRNAGHAASHAFPLMQRVNGGADRVSYFVEQVDERLLDRVGCDRQGALYKLDQRTDLNPCLTDTTDGVEKKTRLTENRDDLQAVVDTVRNLTNAVIRSRRMHDQFDLANMVNYLACRVVVNDFDDVRKNFYLYRDTRDTGEWRILPWDKDGTFGIPGDAGANLPHPFWGDQAHLKANANQWCYLWEALHTDPRTRAMYLRRLRSVMDQQLQPSAGHLEGRAADWFAGLAPHLPAQNIDAITTWLPTRRTQLYVTYTAPDSVAPGLAIPAAQDPAPSIGFGTLDFNPVSGNQAEEYIQLVNTNAVAVDLSGWRLEGGVEHTFDAGTVILAGDAMFIANKAAAFRARALSPRGGETLFVQGNYDGSLSARGETLRLVDPMGTPTNTDDRVVATLTYAGAPTPAQNQLRITELMYHPAAGGAYDREEYEFIELQNIGTNSLNLAGANFTHGITYSFGPVVLAPGAHVVVARNLAAFAARYGASVTPVGPYAGALDNGGERIRIVDAVGEEVLDFTYDDAWQPASDGPGYSLVVSDPGGASWDAWGNAATWRASATLNGSAGAVDRNHSSAERPGRLIIEPDPAGVALTFWGASDWPYFIERSTNLATWTEIAAQTSSPSGRVWLTDAPASPDRVYYRVREQAVAP